MSRRMPVLLVATWLAMPGLAVAEEELTPSKLAQIRREEQAAQDKVNAAYGNRKPSEMSNEERSQAAKEQQAAGQSVLQKHGVSDKDYARRVATLSREEQEAVAQEEKKLEEQEKAARAAKAAAEAEKKRKEEEGLPPEEQEVQLGFSDENPVVLEEKKQEGEVTVEEGLPPGEEGLAGEGATEPVMEQAPAPTPAPAHKGKKSRRK